jgi:hypothetical protein
MYISKSSLFSGSFIFLYLIKIVNWMSWEKGLDKDSIAFI